MYVPLAPMNRNTVKFAKDYRADQIRAAERSRIEAAFKKPPAGEARSVAAR